MFAILFIIATLYFANRSMTRSQLAETDIPNREVHKHFEKLCGAAAGVTAFMTLYSICH